MKNLFLLFFLTFLTFNGYSQVTGRKSGEIIVHLAADYPVGQFLKQVNKEKSQFTLIKTIAADWNMHLLAFDETTSNPDQALYLLRNLSGIQNAQLNFRADDRDTEPNDNEWWREANMKLIETPKAWDAATGGVTPQGDTIVVAVLEKGGDMTHPELAPNHFLNRKEIPNNNIDDDGNGYVDDYKGWNPRTNSDSPGVLGNHGTSVCGIIGAKGNNGVGMSGVNWDVKMMTLGNVEYESEIIAGYQYVAAMRKLYNKTNGQKGAFVVATNASFGIDNASAADHPIWCAVYDSLGKLGVVSIGATANSNSNIDVVGDMPTSCTSEYLITVTSVDNLDKKVNSAAFGPESIDLGSPGTNIYTTIANNGYSTNGGTSFAAPHVSGSIALLYSVKCAEMASDSKTAPAQCATRFRDLILDNVDANTSLTGVTTTGGRLNVGKAMSSITDICGGTSGELAITSIRPNPAGKSTNNIEVFFETPDFDPYNLRVFNMLGQLMLEKPVTPDRFSIKKTEIETSSYPSGMYVIVLGRGKKVVAEKFLKI